MIEKIIIAGAGGQGILLLGQVLAEAAMREDKHVTWIPSYGAEVRGGTAHCMVIISNAEISSPYIDKADTLIMMNSPSLERFKGRIGSRGLILINSSLVDNNILTQMNLSSKPRLHSGESVKICSFPFTDMAIKLGNIRVANMAALGCYLGQKKIIKPKTVVKAMREIAPEDKRELIGINKKAIILGMELINGGR